ncbi:hypothetical protein CEXT_561391 [Caerostris extrusa]|uniref:Uncharacterized protein n=1 Tax=Caerostris extrusa TaxID=172846 RepID=A0AAV4U2R8_CAEEX|nr:hypothetical protein CEXT_561391 [Caerostris extrusa]
MTLKREQFTASQNPDCNTHCSPHNRSKARVGDGRIGERVEMTFKILGLKMRKTSLNINSLNPTFHPSSPSTTLKRKQFSVMKSLTATPTAPDTTDRKPELDGGGNDLKDFEIKNAEGGRGWC